MDWEVALVAVPVVVYFYPKASDIRTPMFGEAYGNTPITARCLPRLVPAAGRKAGTGPADRSLPDPPQYHRLLSPTSR